MVDVAQGEHWTKVIGPFLLYMNAGNTQQQMFADAERKRNEEREAEAAKPSKFELAIRNLKSRADFSCCRR